MAIDNTYLRVYIIYGMANNEQEWFLYIKLTGVSLTSFAIMLCEVSKPEICGRYVGASDLF